MWTIAGSKSECMHFWISVHISLLIQHCMCRRPAFSFFFLCDADTKHQMRPLNTFFTWWMAPWKFHGFIYAIILVMLAYGSAVKGKEWYSLPYLPVTQASALDLCRYTPSIFPRFLPFLCPAGKHTSVMQLDNCFSLVLQHLCFKCRWTGTPMQNSERQLISDSFTVRGVWLEVLSAETQDLGIDHSRL